MLEGTENTIRDNYAQSCSDFHSNRKAIAESVWHKLLAIQDTGGTLELIREESSIGVESLQFYLVKT